MSCRSCQGSRYSPPRRPATHQVLLQNRQRYASRLTAPKPSLTGGPLRRIDIVSPEHFQCNACVSSNAITRSGGARTLPAAVRTLRGPRSDTIHPRGVTQEIDRNSHSRRAISVQNARDGGHGLLDCGGFSVSVAGVTYPERTALADASTSPQHAHSDPFSPIAAISWEPCRARTPQVRLDCPHLARSSQGIRGVVALRER